MKDPHALFDPEWQLIFCLLYLKPEYEDITIYRNVRNNSPNNTASKA